LSHSGISPASNDLGIRPQDDLYLYVNGQWLAEETIPEDRAMTGAFTSLRDGAEAAVRAIIEKAGAAAGEADAQGVEAKIGALYASFMDEAAVESAGAAPLAPRLEAIEAATSIADVVSLMGTLDRTGGDGLFGLYVNNDAGNPERALLHLFQSGLGLPDESYYREEKFSDIRTAYLAHIQAMLELAGMADAGAKGSLSLRATARCSARLPLASSTSAWKRSFITA